MAVLTALLTISGPLSAVDINSSGFVRGEVAYSTADENFWNQQGNTFNGTPITRDSTLLGGGVDTATRAISSDDNDWNLGAVRGELDTTFRFDDSWSAQLRVRGFYAADVYDSYGNTSQFEVDFHGDCGTTLEICGDTYMIDLPSAYVDYNNGGFWLRFGNQQIAWGEMIFFRVLDVPNGLDLRRHSVFDIAAEEFSDTRVPELGLRGSYRFDNGWELEGFAQRFTPSIIPNENTAYNVVGAQFVVHQSQGYNNVDDEINYGGRLRGQIGDLGLQLMAVHRRNPEGVYRWTESGVDNVPVIGPLLAATPFEIAPEGVWSAAEWFAYAGRVRLDGVKGLDASINDFPASQLLGGVPTDVLSELLGCEPYVCASQELDFFFQGLGPLRGHIQRFFPSENIYGLGANYVITAEPGSFLDQLIIRFEATFTPDKKFTALGLDREPIEEDEWVTSLGFEKYHKFSDAFPATYFVLQWMYRSESDMFARNLGGMGADVNSVPDGNDSWNAIAFAFQQPFPNLIWRADLSILYDLEGGALVQPAVKWKPNRSWTLEGFANLLKGGGDNEDIIDTVDWASELALRVTFQF